MAWPTQHTWVCRPSNNLHPKEHLELSLCLRIWDLSNWLDSVSGKQSLPFLLFIPRYLVLGVQSWALIVETQCPCCCSVSNSQFVVWRYWSSDSAARRKSSMYCKNMTFSVLDLNACTYLWRASSNSVGKFLKPGGNLVHFNWSLFYFPYLFIKRQISVDLI